MSIIEVLILWGVLAIVLLSAMHKEAKRERKRWRKRYNMRRGNFKNRG